MPSRPRPRPLSCGCRKLSGSKPAPSSWTTVRTAEGPNSRAILARRAPECRATLLTASWTIRKIAVAAAPGARCSSPPPPRGPLMPRGGGERVLGCFERNKDGGQRLRRVIVQLPRQALALLLLGGDRLGQELAPDPVEGAELTVPLLHLACPLVDTAFELLRPAGAFLEGGLQLDAHLVEAAGQLPDLVVAGDRDRALQVAGGHSRGIPREAPDRAHDRVGVERGGGRRRS